MVYSMVLVSTMFVLPFVPRGGFCKKLGIPRNIPHKLIARYVPRYVPCNAHV